VNSALYLLADMKVREGFGPKSSLKSWLAHHRREGRSYDWIAKELWTTVAVHVSHETVRTWCFTLDIEKGR
jgi:hypothetical protein